MMCFFFNTLTLALFLLTCLMFVKAKNDTEITTEYPVLSPLLAPFQALNHCIGMNEQVQEFKLHEVPGPSQPPVCLYKPQSQSSTLLKVPRTFLIIVPGDYIEIQHVSKNHPTQAI